MRSEADPEVGARQIPFEARVASRDTGAQTLIVTESYETRSEIPDALFTAKHLMQGDEEKDREGSE